MNDNTVTKFVVGKAVKFLLTIALLVAVGTLLLDLVVPGHLGPAMRMTMFALAGGAMLLAAVIFVNRQMSQMQVRDYKDRQRQEANPVERVDGVLSHAVDETRQDVADDIEDIKSGRITRAQVYTVLAVLGGMVTLYQGIVYEKFSLSATWIGIPVWMFAAVGSVLIFAIGASTPWFKDRQFKTPWWVFAIAMVALPLSIVLGLNFTEPTELGGKTPHELAMSQQGYRYDYQQTRGGYWYYQSFYSTSSSSNSSSGGGGDSSSSCTGDDCGYFWIFVGFVALTLILLIGSMVIAHFWFFAAAIFSTIALLMAIQAIRYRPRKQPVREEAWRY